MVSPVFIGLKIFFARACAHAYENIHELIAIAMIFAFSFTASAFAADPESLFVRGNDSRIHSVRLTHYQDQTTKQTMGISGACRWIKSQASAMALVGSEGATLDPRIKSTRGVIALEGLITGAEPKVLDTVLLSPYKNYPTNIPGESGKMPGTHYPLAITIAAKLAGQGDLVLHKGDTLIVHADGQLYAYSLPNITIPSEGVVRLYLGTDDTLYYDATLKHPFHSGACGAVRGAHGR